MGNACLPQLSHMGPSGAGLHSTSIAHHILIMCCSRRDADHLFHAPPKLTVQADLNLATPTSVLNRWSRSTHDALLERPAARVSCLPNTSSETSCIRIGARVPKWTTAQDALQWLSTEMDKIVIHFALSSKELLDCVHESLQSSTTRIKACMKHFDKAGLHFLAERNKSGNHGF